MKHFVWESEEALEVINGRNDMVASFISVVLDVIKADRIEHGEEVCHTVPFLRPGRTRPTFDFLHQCKSM